MATIKPLKSLQELIEWEPSQVDPEAVAKSMSKTMEQKPVNQPKLLVCHDMAGGYNEDR